MGRFSTRMLTAFIAIFGVIALIGAQPAAAATTHTTAYFYSPTGVAPTGATVYLQDMNGNVLRTSEVGLNDRIIMLSPRVNVGETYCMSVDATYLGYELWYGCNVAAANKLHFDVYLDPIDVWGTVTQNGNERPVAGAEVCLVELGTCTVTDASGAYAFSGVPSGTYTVSVNTAGFKSTSTTLTVGGEDTVVPTIVQYRGNGQPGRGNN